MPRLQLFPDRQSQLSYGKICKQLGYRKENNSFVTTHDFVRILERLLSLGYANSHLDNKILEHVTKELFYFERAHKGERPNQAVWNR